MSDTTEIELTFNTEGNRTRTITIPAPKEASELTATEIKKAAADIAPILMTASGDKVTTLKSARLVTSSAKDLLAGGNE